MRIVTFRAIKDFLYKDATASVALFDWYHKVSKANWNNLLDLKKDFNGVDYVGNDRYVFNIKGNNYRIICIIIFASRKVYIRFIGSHSDYNKINAKII